MQSCRAYVYHSLITILWNRHSWDFYCCFLPRVPRAGWLQVSWGNSPCEYRQKLGCACDCQGWQETPEIAPLRERHSLVSRLTLKWSKGPCCSEERNHTENFWAHRWGWGCGLATGGAQPAQAPGSQKLQDGRSKLSSAAVFMVSYYAAAEKTIKLEV